MEIPKRPSKAHTILAKSTDRKVVDSVTGQRGPLYRWFTKTAWDVIPKKTVNGKTSKKQGFVQIDPKKIEIPPESLEALKKLKEGDTDVQNTDEVKEVVDLDLTIKKLKEGDTDVESTELLNLINSKKLPIANPLHLPKYSLIEEILKHI